MLLSSLRSDLNRTRTRKAHPKRPSLSLCRSCRQHVDDDEEDEDEDEGEQEEAVIAAPPAPARVRSPSPSTCSECASVGAAHEACTRAWGARTGGRAAAHASDARGAARAAFADAQDARVAEKTNLALERCIHAYINNTHTPDAFSLSTFANCQYSDSHWCHMQLRQYVAWVMRAAVRPIPVAHVSVAAVAVAWSALVVAALVALAEAAHIVATRRRVRTHAAVAHLRSAVPLDIAPLYSASAAHMD